MDLKEVLKNNSDKEVIYMIGYGFRNHHNSGEPLGFLDGLKIGYSNNLPRRMAIYQKELIDFDFISIRDGDLALESAIHVWYSEYRLNIRRLVEWFRDYDYIRDTFEIIPDEVFLRFSKNRYNPRDINNLYRFGLKYLMKDPDNDFEQEMLWRLSAGSNISIESLSDISEDLIRDIYQFSEKYLKLSLRPIEDILNNLEEIKNNFISVKKSLDKESTLKRLSYEILAIPKFEDKMRKCCEYYSIDSGHPIFNYLPTEFKEYLDILGPSGLSKASWQKSKIKSMISEISLEIKGELLDSETNKDCMYNLIKNELTNYIIIGKKYSKREVKKIFKQIKDKYGLPIVPKSVLINDYYNTCPSKVTDPETNKYAIGYKILSFLDQ